MSQTANDRARPYGLTDLERRYLIDLVAGCSQKEIARRLDIDVEAAERVMRALLKKLDAKYTADAVRKGIIAGL